MERAICSCCWRDPEGNTFSLSDPWKGYSNSYLWRADLWFTSNSIGNPREKEVRNSVCINLQTLLPTMRNHGAQNRNAKEDISLTQHGKMERDVGRHASKMQGDRYCLFFGISGFWCKVTYSLPSNMFLLAERHQNGPGYLDFFFALLVEWFGNSDNSAWDQNAEEDSSVKQSAYKRPSDTEKGWLRKPLTI